MTAQPTPEVALQQKGYVHPEALVTTQWVSEHLNDPNVRIVESDEDVLLYESGHIPSAVKIDWHTDLQDPLERDYLAEDQFERLMQEKGISNDTTVVFYGDRNNWWACYAFWVFKLFGHEDCRIMDGGRTKWESEGRPMTREAPQHPKGNYKAKPRHDFEIRAFRDDVVQHIDESKPLVDVRSPGEYRGELLHMPDYPQEGALRGGHIPGAKNVPWARAANEDATFKSADELRKIYEEEVGLNRDQDVIAYCRIGERSSHTWFVLKYLLGYPYVRNYDGSWTEWGNMVRAPIEK
jgi:thiosulfate/3-mercaptopyruvate sulfurtransferase